MCSRCRSPQGRWNMRRGGRGKDGARDGRHGRREGGSRAHLHAATRESVCDGEGEGHLDVWLCAVVCDRWLERGTGPRPPLRVKRGRRRHGQPGGTWALGPTRDLGRVAPRHGTHGRARSYRARRRAPRPTEGTVARVPAGDMSAAARFTAPFAAGARPLERRGSGHRHPRRTDGASSTFSTSAPALGVPAAASGALAPRPRADRDRHRAARPSAR